MHINPETNIATNKKTDLTDCTCVCMPIHVFLHTYIEKYSLQIYGGIGGVQVK